MSDSELTPNPRRSQRQRKQVQHLSASPRKRKRSEPEDVSEPESVSSPDEDQDEPEFRAAKPKPRKKAGSLPKKSTVKKPRTTKQTGALKRATKATTKKPTKKTEGEASGSVTAADGSAISSDNPIFNTLLNPAAALQSVVEDFLDSLQQTPGPAQAELITSILRACGSNDTVDEDQVVDYDGVVDVLDNLTEGLKQEDTPLYPLTSKLPRFRTFHKSLSEFIDRLISSAAELGSLYSSDIMTTLSTWIVAMSSSQLRSFRHTATFIALQIETSLCDVAAAVEKEAEVIGRQRQGEKKRKAAGQGGGRVREKELEAKANQVKERRTQLAEFIKEFVDGVFVHRYRDLDPSIRAECVRSLGQWFTKYPSHFLDASYLRYVGWVLSDSNTHVRVEAVRALSGVYNQGDYISSLNHFTERFKPRLIEMAKSDIELSVRVSVIQVLTAIDEHSLLEDEEREALCLLACSTEPRVRKAIGPFVGSVWKDVLEERMVGKEDSDDNQHMAGAKALASLLVKWSRSLDKNHPEYGDGSDYTGVSKEVISLLAGQGDERIRSIVEALWDEVEAVSDWSSLLDFLLLDHSADENDRSRRSISRESEEESSVDEAWRLEESEEGVLLELLIASIRHAQAVEQANKKGDLESLNNNITRALIKGLPRLITKHQTDQQRISQVLLLVPLMNMDLYLEMRILPTYASLWDDVTKQFLSHSSLLVLNNAAQAVCHFLGAKSLNNTNATKLIALEDDLSTALRDAIGGREEMEVATLTEDEVLTLTAICSRLAIFAGIKDITSWMEENEGGKQSSAWDIILALAERGRLGYKEEELMVEQAIHLLYLFIVWKIQGLIKGEEQSSELHKKTLKEQRDTLFEKLSEFCLGSQSNTGERIKCVAFRYLINLYISFRRADWFGEADAEDSLLLTMDDEAQHRCAGFLQAEIERYAEEMEDASDVASNKEDKEDSSSDSDDDEQDKPAQKDRKSAKMQKIRQEKLASLSSRGDLDKEHTLFDIIATFVRALRAGIIHIQHSAVILAQYGRLGPPGLSCSKAVVSILQMQSDNLKDGELIVPVVCQALEDAFTLVLDGLVRDEDYAVSLAKTLQPCLATRRTPLVNGTRIGDSFFVQVHTTLISWILKRYTAFDSSQNKRKRKLVVTLFRSLVQLLSSATTETAKKIKTYMDEALAQAKIEISPASKLWEPQRAYDKRLSASLAKSGALPHTKGRGKQPKEVITSDDEEMDVVEELVKTTPRPRPRRVTRNQQPQPSTSPPPTSENEGEKQTEDDQERQTEDEQEKQTEDEQENPTEGVEEEEEPPARSSPAASQHSSVVGTPGRSTRKRRQPEEEEGADQQTTAEEEPTTPTNDARFRRKRVRR